MQIDKLAAKIKKNLLTESDSRLRVKTEQSADNKT